MKKITNVIKYLFFLSIGILLLYYAFKGVPIQRLWSGLKHANYEWVAITVLLGIVAYVARAYRWNLLIETLGYKPPLLHTTSAVLVGYLANIAFPRLGEVSRCAMLRKSDGIPFEGLVGTVIVERAFDIFTLIFLLIVVTIAKISIFGAFFNDHLLAPIGNKIDSSLSNTPLLWIIVIVIILATLLLLYLLKNKIGATTPFLKVKKIAKGVIQGLKSGYQMKRRKEFFLATVILWTCYWLMSWLIVFSIPATASLGPMDGLFLLVAGSIGMTAPVQGGFGTFHFIVTMALALYGIPREDGLIIATLSHESQTIFAILLGTIGFYIIMFLAKKEKSLIKD